MSVVQILKIIVLWLKTINLLFLPAPLRHFTLPYMITINKTHLLKPKNYYYCVDTFLEQLSFLILCKTGWISSHFHIIWKKDSASHCQNELGFLQETSILVCEKHFTNEEKVIMQLSEVFCRYVGVDLEEKWLQIWDISCSWKRWQF